MALGHGTQPQALPPKFIGMIWSQASPNELACPQPQGFPEGLSYLKENQLSYHGSQLLAGLIDNIRHPQQQHLHDEYYYHKSSSIIRPLL